MVNISKQALGEKELGKLFAQLNQVIGKLDAKQSALFLKDFLGEEEQIMLSKRLAAILMLHHRQSLYTVARTLKISSAAADNFRTKLDEGAYDHMLAAIQKNKSGYIELLDAVDSILHLGGILPHYGQTYASEAYKRSRKSFS
jgi:hypothetical protein